MDPRSEVLIRQSAHFQENVLLAGLPADDLLAKFPQCLGWSWLFNDQQVLQQRFAERLHTGTTAPAIEVPAATLFLPKSKELAAYLLQAIASCVQKDGFIYLIGEKKSGIEGAAKNLLSVYGKASKLDSARHCQLWRVQLTEKITAPVLGSLVRSYSVATAKQALTVKSLPGVFSHGKLDQGTQLLIEHLDGLPTGKMLDFGCGAGVIGALLKQRYPNASVYLQDIDAFALASSELTLQANQLEGTVLEGNGITDAPVGLSAIISNPPFHQGIQTSYHTTEQLLQEAIVHLRTGGELRLVANSFLKYQAIIEQTFGNCKILADTKGFRIYSAFKQP